MSWMIQHDDREYWWNGLFWTGDLEKACRYGMIEIAEETCRRIPESQRAKVIDDPLAIECRELLKRIVVTEGDDAGVILLSEHAPTHVETRDGRQVDVYDLEYFSPLGEALMELWHKLGGE